MTRNDMIEDGSVEESPGEAGDTQPQASQAQSGDGEPEGAAQREGEVEGSQEELQGSKADDSQLVHFAAGRCSEDEPDDAELVHKAAGRCSDDEPLSALKPEGAEQPQGERPQDGLGDSQLEGAQHREEQREESQGHEVNQLDPEPLKPNERFLALYERFGFSPPASTSSDGEPLSALTPAGAEQAQGERPQASQRLELADELDLMLEGTTQLDGELGDSLREGAQRREAHREESHGHEVSQLHPEHSKPDESFRALYERLARSEPEPRCL